MSLVAMDMKRPPLVCDCEPMTNDRSFGVCSAWEHIPNKQSASITHRRSTGIGPTCPATLLRHSNYLKIHELERAHCLMIRAILRSILLLWKLAAFLFNRDVCRMWPGCAQPP